MISFNSDEPPPSAAVRLSELVIPSVQAVFCPTYSAYETAVDTQNYQICTFTACGGDLVTVSGCDTCTGDQYLRLFDDTGKELLHNDDGCGTSSSCSAFTYSVSGSSSVCRTYYIHEGCFSGECAGTIKTTGSTPFPVVDSTTVLNNFYRAWNTSSTTENYINAYFTACGGSSFSVSGCDTCNGDQVLRLFQTDGAHVLSADDSCGMCSAINYTVPGRSTDCIDFNLREGCFGSQSCNGTVTISGVTFPTSPPSVSLAPSMTPVITPPSSLPTPTALPTVNTIVCPHYSVSDTDSATQNYASCSFVACGGSTVTVSGCGCTGDQYLALFDNTLTLLTYSDDSCDVCSQFSYKVSGDASECLIFAVHEGCFASSTCSGTVTVYGADSVGPVASPSVPTMYPTVYSTNTFSNFPFEFATRIFVPVVVVLLFVLLAGAAYYWKVLLGSTGSSAYSRAPEEEKDDNIQLTCLAQKIDGFDAIHAEFVGDGVSFTCPQYFASNTSSAAQNFTSCSFYACGGTVLNITGCGACSGDQYLRLIDITTAMQVSSNDNDCGSCSGITYSVPGDSTSCNAYNIQEGCFSSETCSGTVTVSGSQSGQIMSPTYSPTVVTLSPSLRPSYLPSRAPSVKPTSSSPSYKPQYSSYPTYIWPTVQPSYAPVTNYPTAASQPFTCPQYSAKNTNYADTNYAKCEFVACTGQYVTISGCNACSGDQYIEVYRYNDYYDDAYYQWVASSDDDCGLCSYTSFTAPTNYGADVCFTYTIQEGCYSDNSCSGTLYVTGASHCLNCGPEPWSLSTFAAAKGYVSLSFLAAESSTVTEFSDQTVHSKQATPSAPPSTSQQLDNSVISPIQPVEYGDDIEHPQQTAVVTVQPTGRTSLQQSLVLNEVVTGGCFPSSKEVSVGYPVFVPAEDKNLFGVPGLKVESQIYGLVTLSTQVFSLLTFLLSYALSPNKSGLFGSSVLIMFIYHVVISWIAVPIWQNYSILDREGNHVDCAGNGCIYCRILGVGCQLCACGQLSFKKRTGASCCFIPLSLYNLFYMIRHPGMRINNELPDDLEEFGFGRGYFLLFSLNVRGSLNLYIFLNCVFKLLLAKVDGFSGDTLLSVLSLCFATLNLKLYFVSLFFGLYFLPFAYLLTFMMCCRDCCQWVDYLKSKKGTRQFNSFLWVWKHVKDY